MTSVTWLGQCGFYIDTGDLRIMTDPYLSDYLQELMGPSMRRLVPADPAYLSVTPDVMILTHDHQDHMDMPTLQKILLDAPPAIILAPGNAFGQVKANCGKQHNYVLFEEGTEWTQNGVRFKAVKAIHSDRSAIGVLISTEQETIYLTGDTLYSKRIADSVDEPVDLMLAVMNGKGNNMNAVDAARLAKDIQPKAVAPIHWGMFEDFTDDPMKFVEVMAGSGIAVHVPDFFKTETIQEFMQANK